MSKEILESLDAIARHELGVERHIELEDKLIEDLALDSLKLLSLAVAVENCFEICLDEDDEDELLTVKDLVELIERKQSETE